MTKSQRMPVADRIAVAVMARAPSDKHGKTRLVSALDSADSLSLRRALLVDTLEVVRRVGGSDRLVLFSPATAEAEFATLTGGTMSLIPQRGNDLGERMDHGFRDLFARGYSGALVVGSDLPTLPPAYLEQAVAELTRHIDPVVLGPALDGGYYLIGLRRNHPALFRSIPWSTSATLSATLDAAERAELPVSLVPPWYDVDSVDDLRRVLDASAGTIPNARHTKAWLASRFGGA
ncbi:MAG: TIGR04282 family arsenosugar biosynthesis glycosyltransferase [Acidobacteria bacterium]|nr:TIGR04282 family arsenosugar biosynthesis glycosyltransferase [Acidobacteriota bacterium]MBI3261912.1 TIGR04282 family arsenosugar biosynthesis glycosyltransferase [Acidobacteriota bacterium]